MIKWIKEEITKIWENEAPAMCTKLGIDIPTFKQNDNRTTNVLGMTHLICDIQSNFFCTKYTAVRDADLVELYPYTIRNISRYIAPGGRKRAITYVIRQIILHELRHIWQITHMNSAVCQDLTNRKNLQLRPTIEALSPTEMDADDYAISQASTKEELMMFKAMANMHGRRNKDLGKAISKLFLKYTLPKAVLAGVAIGGIAIAVSKLIKKKGKKV